MKGRRPIRVVPALMAVALLLIAGCGDSDESKTFSDQKIVDTLDLEETAGSFAMGGDPFCEVEDNLLNDADEVQKAADRDDLGLVIASREGNVGIRGVPPFAPDCQQQAKKKLNKLDPKPKEEE
jgi:hypothetical protein